MTQTKTYTRKNDPKESGIYLTWGKDGRSHGLSVCRFANGQWYDVATTRVSEQPTPNKEICDWEGPLVLLQNSQGAPCVPGRSAISRQEIMEKVAQVWCSKENENKSMDVGLAEGFTELACNLLQGCELNEKSLRQIQHEIAEWSRRNFGDNVSKATGQRMFSTNALLGIGEEFGELAHVVLKRHQGIRGYDDDAKYKAERDDAIADLLVYLCDFSDRESVDLQEVLNAVWKKVQKRDWEKNKVNADKIADSQ